MPVSPGGPVTKDEMLAHLQRYFPEFVIFESRAALTAALAEAMRTAPTVPEPKWKTEREHAAAIVACLLPEADHA